MHNIRDLGIRRLLEGHPRGVMKCATKTLPVRRSPGATFGRCVSRKNYRYCEITFCDLIGRAGMIAFTASWMMISSNVMPPNALTTAPSSSRTSRTARGAAERHPPDQSPDSLPEIAFSVEACVRRQGVGSVLFRKLIAEARSKGYHSLRITTGAQNQAMRALANKFGAHLFFHDTAST